jgi:hypothetical protein
MRGGEPRGNRTLARSCCRRRFSPETRLMERTAGIERASAGSQPALVARRVPSPCEHPWVVVESHHVLSGFNRALSLDQLTTRCRAPSRAQRAPGEGIEPSRVRLTAGCLTIRLRWNGQGAGASRPPVVWHRVVKEQCPLAEGKRVRRTQAASRPGGFGGRDRTCIAGVRGQRPSRWTTPNRNLIV